MKYSSVCGKCATCTHYKKGKCLGLLEYHKKDCPQEWERNDG